MVTKCLLTLSAKQLLHINIKYMSGCVLRPLIPMILQKQPAVPTEAGCAQHTRRQPGEEADPLKLHVQMDEEGAGRNLCLTWGVGDQVYA